MDAVETGWKRVKGGEKIQMIITGITKTFNFNQPQLSVPALVQLYKAIKALPEENWRNKKLAETQNIIEECAGLFAEAVTQEEYAVQGDNLKINFNVNNRTGVPAVIKEFSVISSNDTMQQQSTQVKSNSNPTVSFIALSKPVIADSSVRQNLTKNQNVSVDYAFRIDDHAAVSQPYWLQNSMKEGYFDVKNQLLIGEVENKPEYTARFIIEIEGEDFTVERPVQYKFTDPVRGELYEPVTIIPKVMVSVSPGIVLSNVVPSANPLLYVNYLSNINAAKVPVTLTIKNGSSTNVFKKVPMDFRKGVAGSVPVKLKDVFIHGQKSIIQPVLTLQLNGKDELFNQNVKTIKYEHIPYLNYFYPDDIRVIDTEIKTVGKKIGFIAGAGDKVPDALSAMGFGVTFLNQADMNFNYLQQFDAIVVGVRAYNINEYLSNKNDILNQYIENGGNLIVQYIRGNQAGTKDIKAGPYPFSVSSTRVTEENAKVDFLLPGHPAFNYPNKITQKDFAGWVQERSTYQADQTDAHYEKLLSMSDTDEPKSDGSLVIAKYGKGNFAYVSLVLFRQLPAGVPGAYRLLANLIALPKNK